MLSLLDVKSQSYVPCQNLCVSFGHTCNAVVRSTLKVIFQAYGDRSLETHLSHSGDRSRNGNSFLGLVGSLHNNVEYLLGCSIGVHDRKIVQSHNRERLDSGANIPMKTADIPMSYWPTSMRGHPALVPHWNQEHTHLTRFMWFI
jgi:hypothetical protein